MIRTKDLCGNRGEIYLSLIFFPCQKKELGEVHSSHFCWLAFLVTGIQISVKDYVVSLGRKMDREATSQKKRRTLKSLQNGSGPEHWPSV